MPLPLVAFPAAPSSWCAEMAYYFTIYGKAYRLPLWAALAIHAGRMATSLNFLASTVPMALLACWSFRSAGVGVVAVGLVLLAIVIALLAGTIQAARAMRRDGVHEMYVATLIQTTRIGRVLSQPFRTSGQDKSSTPM